MPDTSCCPSFNCISASLKNIYPLSSNIKPAPLGQLIMSLALTDVKRVANLAQLELSEDQAVKTLGQLNGIFALVEQMSAVDTTGIEPLSHPIAAYTDQVSLRFRDDVATEPDRRAEYQQPAPATQDGLYLVPKVIE